ncbi:MAG: hypothetical protein ACXVRH_08775 [Thermoleophilaceae bacterium]
MSRPGVQVLLWGTYLAVLTVILWIWWPNWLSVVQLGSAAVFVALVAILFTVAHRGGPLGDTKPEPTELRVLPDMSVGAALIAIGLCGMLYGSEFGLFLVLICAGIVALGVARLVSELRREA